jgi:hypothetical protein
MRMHLMNLSCPDSLPYYIFCFDYLILLQALLGSGRGESSAPLAPASSSSPAPRAPMSRTDAALQVANYLPPVGHDRNPSLGHAPTGFLHLQRPFRHFPSWMTRALVLSRQLETRPIGASPGRHGKLPRVLETAQICADGENVLTTPASSFSTIAIGDVTNGWLTKTSRSAIVTGDAI